MHALEGAKRSRIHRGIWAALAGVVSVSMLIGLSAPAGAQDTGAADASAMAVDAQQLLASSRNANARSVNLDPAAAQCAADDWTALKDCVAKATGDTLVTITASIAVPRGASIDIDGRTIALTSNIEAAANMAATNVTAANGTSVSAFTIAADDDPSKALFKVGNGGAIYTESKTVTYVAKAVAYDNAAGHFGGGLWLCPSGTGTASKGGNIALFDNRVDSAINPNNSANDSPYPNDVPYSGTALVKWEQDDAGKWHRETGTVSGTGTNLAVTMTGSRYADTNETNRTKVEMDASHMHTIKLTRRVSSTDGSLTDGMALKAVVRGATEAEHEQTKNAAKKAAAITFTGNAARLSGGAFATNGDVKFSTPYTASWSKTDAASHQQIAGAQWQVTLIRDASGTPVTNGATHTVTDCVDAADATEANKCASKNAGNVFADKDGTAAAGMFNIAVDKPGTYKLQESAAPDGYWQPAGDTYYTFTITANDDGDVQLHQADGTTAVAGNNIVNQRPTVSWSKVATDSHTLLPGSRWSVRGPLTKNATTGTLEAISGKTITASVTDCRSANGYCATQPNVLDGADKTYQDLDEASGKLRIAGLAPAPDEQTEYWYELTETQAPSGFVTSTVVYTFHVGYRQPNADIRIDAPQGASLPVRHDLDQATIGINAIENVRDVAALPFTGGGTSRDWMIAGGGIAMIAALATATTQIWRRRKALAGMRPTTRGRTR